MILLEGVSLSKLCDYSFGDQSGSFGNVLVIITTAKNMEKKCICVYISVCELYEAPRGAKPHHFRISWSIVLPGSACEVCFACNSVINANYHWGKY